MSDTTDPIFDTAKRWLVLHGAEHLSRDRDIMIERGVRQLRQAFDLRHADAERILLQALGVVESRGSPVYIDTARSTAHTVFLVDPLRQRTIVFTAQDLLDRVWSGKQQALSLHHDTGAIRAAS